MHQEPNSISLHPDIPATQPIVDPETGKRPSEPPTPRQSTKKSTLSPGESTNHSANPSTKPIGKESAKQSINLSTKHTTTSLNDTAFTPLSMRALYYTPEGASNDLPEGIPEGDVRDILSPSSSTNIIRKKGTNLVFDASYPTPQPSPQQYLLKVHAAAFCHDEIRLATALNPPISSPQIPLHSICGTVVSTPREDDELEEGPRFRIGDLVFGLVSYTRDGGAADYTVATEKELAPKPDNISIAEGAAIALPALTAWQALFRYAGLDPDVPGGLNEDDEEFGQGGNGTGRWQWQRKRRDTVLGSMDYGYGHRKSTAGTGMSARSSRKSPGDVDSGAEQRSGTANDNASGSTGDQSGHWIWHWNRRDTILNDKASGASSAGGTVNIDDLPRAASKLDPNPETNPSAKPNGNVRKESLASLVSGTPKATGKAPRAASTIDPHPKNSVRRASLINLVRGNPKTDPGTTSSAGSGSSTTGTRRASLLNRMDKNGRLGSLVNTNANTNEGTGKPPKIRVLVTNARDNEIGRIAVQMLRAETLFPVQVRPWICVTCTPPEADIIERDWKVDEIIVIPHLPSADECNISKVFRARRWHPVDIVLDCAGGEVFRQAHAAGVVKDHGAVLTVVDSKVALQSPLVPENDELGERKRGIRSRFVPVNPDGPAIERVGELIEENLVRAKEARIVDIARGADLLAAGAAGTAGGLRGDMVVVKVQ
ncbi:unnamed protein product [Penicillium salamii]|nr:unnamed protein product [Penicillium salamii]